MKSLIEKIDEWIAQTGWKQTALERHAGLPANRIAKWRVTGEPTLRQAFRMARVMGVDVSYLADDQLDEPPVTSELSIDEQSALELFRDLRAAVGAPRAIAELAKLAACPGKPVAEPKPHGPAKWLGGADLSALDAANQREDNKPKKVEPKKGGKPAPGGKRR